MKIEPKTETLDIVVIGYNEAEGLSRCLNAAREASSRLEKELKIPSNIIYVDSQSTDDSVNIAKKEGFKVLFAPPFFRTPANGRNAGLFLTAGTYVMFLDGDMEVHEDWFVSGIKFLKNRRDAAGVGGLRDDIRLTPKGNLLKIENYYNVTKDVSTVGSRVGGGFMFRRSALLEIGGFEPEHYEEEFFAYMCLIEKGWELYRISKPMIVHWDTKLKQASSIISKLILGRFTTLPGAFLRYSLLGGVQRLRLVKFYWSTIAHIFILLAVFLSTLAALKFPGLSIFLCSGVGALAIFYVAWVFKRKGNILLGISAFFLETVYSCNMIYGFIFNRPKIRYGLRFSREYYNMIIKANKGTVKGGDNEGLAI